MQISFKFAISLRTSSFNLGLVRTELPAKFTIRNLQAHPSSCPNTIITITGYHYKLLVCSFIIAASGKYFDNLGFSSKVGRIQILIVIYKTS